MENQIDDQEHTSSASWLAADGGRAGCPPRAAGASCHLVGDVDNATAGLQHHDLWKGSHPPPLPTGSLSLTLGP